MRSSGTSALACGPLESPQLRCKRAAHVGRKMVHSDRDGLADLRRRTLAGGPRALRRPTAPKGISLLRDLVCGETHPPNLSILISGGKETNRDSLSKGD